ncbi:mariner Mos1 transposase [Trichonephila clavipes]|nr:mariner Mos1 transposase [Trichonephila clavipes]
MMAKVFWDSHGVILIDYLQKGKTITGAYCTLLLDKLKAEFEGKRPHFQKKKVLFHQDNAPWLEKRKEGRKNEGNRSKKTKAGFYSGDPGVLDRDADDESWTQIRENALRTVPRQAVRRATLKRGYHTG